MADEFINELTNTTTIKKGDMFVIETEPGGIPQTKNMLWDDLENLIMDFVAYQIVPSVSSNNLTVAIKDRAGNDATVDKLVKFKVGDSLYALASSASITKNAGTNWCNLGSAELAAKATDLFVYAIGETGASAGLKFGFSRVPYARTMNDFVNTTTSERYIAGNWTNFNASDAVQVIGRFRAQLSASASFNWSIASALVINRPIYETDWLDYLPSGIAASNVTKTGKYKIRNQEVEVYIKVAFTGGITFTTMPSLPFTVSANHFEVNTALNMSGTSGYIDAGTGNFPNGLQIGIQTSATTISLSTGALPTGISATSPITWANGDVLSAHVFPYRIYP